MTTAKIEIRANDRTKKAFESVNKRLRGMGSILTSTQAKIGALVGAAGFGAMIARSSQMQDSLAKTVDKLNANAQAFSGLQYAVKNTADVTDGALAEALTKASKRLGEFNATGGGASAKWLEKLNLDTRELANLQPSELFMRYSESIRGLNDRGQQMAAISALMGDEARGLINTIDAGPEALRAMSDEAEALGVAMDRAELAKIEAANDAIARSMTVVEGAANRVTVAMAPYIEALSNTFADAAVEHRGFEQQILEGTKKITTSVAFLGDMWRVVEIAVKGVEVVLWGLATATNSVLSVVETAINGYVEMANLMGANLKPMETFTTLATDSAEATKRAAAEMHELAMEPLPSDSVEAFFGKIEAEADKAAQAVARAKSGNVGGAGGGMAAGPMPGFDDGTSDRLARLRESLMGERETLQLHFEERSLLVEDAFQQNLIRETERKQLLEQLEHNHLQRIHAMNLDAFQDQAKLDRSLWQTKTATALGGMVQLTAGVAQHSKAMFEINKRAAIADALVNAPAAASGAYRFGANIGGPVLGAAFAATALYAEMAKVQAIRSTSFQGGGGGTTPSSAGSTPTVNNQPVQSAPPIASSPSSDVASEAPPTIIIQGNVYGNEDFAEEVVRTYLDARERDRF